MFGSPLTVGQTQGDLGPVRNRILLSSRDLSDGELAFALSNIPFCSEVVQRKKQRSRKRRNLELNRQNPCWVQAALASPNNTKWTILELPCPVRVLTHLLGPLGFQKAEIVATNIGDYIINIRSHRINLLANLRLHFQ